MNSHFRITRAQRGVALLIAIFALLLLSAIGMGMMFSANTETNINENYREKQIAVYAAIAGAMEAKDRLTSGGDITVPAGVPTLGSKNVVYIINPLTSSDTVAPWDSSNAYWDSELCHENVLGLTSSGVGTQCPQVATSLPDSSAVWYTKLDDSSSSYTGSFKLNSPLNYKWTRIQLKTNNSTPWAVDGTSSNTNQVCWNGYSQIPLPTGYNPDCTPNGSVTKLTLVSGGSGYSNPTITISSPPTGGTKATAKVTTCTGGCPLSKISVTDGGSGYTYAPTVTVAAPPGSGTTATATATIVPAGSPITSITQGATSTACWSDAAISSPNWANGVQFTAASGQTGAGGQATVNVSSGYNCVAGVTFTGGTCSSASHGTNAGFTIAGGNSDFVGYVNIPNNGKLNGAAVNITNPGTGYTSAASATVSFTSASCSGTAVTVTLGHTLNGPSASPAGVVLSNPGAGYSVAPSAAFSVAPTAGVVPSVTATIGATASGQVVSVTITNAGSGYTSAPAVTISGGCGTVSSPTTCTKDATLQAAVSGAIDSISILTGGSGYTAPPTVTITGGGSGAQAIASISAGTYYSPVYLITSLGISPAGARSMVQVEAAPAIRALSMPGALTLDGPQPNFGAPNSNNFKISGTDNVNGGAGTAPAPVGCDSTANPSHPSIGVYDNPNLPTTPTSVETVLTDIPTTRAETNYPGLSASPDVQNVYGALGDQGTTPSGMDSIVSAISALPGASVYSGDQTDSTINIGSSNGASPPLITPAIDVVYGNLTFNGNNSGYGILVVTGTLTFKGNFTWNGLVLVIGQGDIEFSGGGSGTINGSVMVAKTKDSSGNELSTLGTPTLNWSGGGGNGIYYDHCYADNYLSMIPMTVPASAKPLTILSIKTLAY